MQLDLNFILAAASILMFAGFLAVVQRGAGLVQRVAIIARKRRKLSVITHPGSAAAQGVLQPDRVRVGDAL